jgi:hypothetical protein
MEYVIAGLIALAFVGFIAWRVYWNKVNAPAYPKWVKDTNGDGNSPGIPSDTDRLN